MANKQNLIPNNERSPAEVRENGKKGGIASGKARRNKKLLRDCMEILLEKKVQDKNGQKLTGAEAVAVAVFKKALKGDIKAAEFLRDTAGQKPVEKIAFAEIDPAVIAEVERMVEMVETDRTIC